MRTRTVYIAKGCRSLSESFQKQTAQRTRITITPQSRTRTISIVEGCRSYPEPYHARITLHIHPSIKYTKKGRSLNKQQKQLMY